MSVGVLARGMLKEPLVHDQFCCSTELEGEKQVVDPVSKQPKTEKFKYMCKEPITPKNASTCCSCSRIFCSKPTCMFPKIELEEFEDPKGNGPKEKKAEVLKGSVCAVCKAMREESKGGWLVKAPKPQEPPPAVNPFQAIIDILNPPPLTEEQMEKEKERKEKAVRGCACITVLLSAVAWLVVFVTLLTRVFLTPLPPHSPPLCFLCCRTKSFKTKSTNSSGKFRLG